MTNLTLAGVTVCGLAAQRDRVNQDCRELMRKILTLQNELSEKIKNRDSLTESIRLIRQQAAEDELYTYPRGILNREKVR